MARASRSNKKQPAFDPSELQDLIFSPAVGTGVGSHLLGTPEHSPASAETQQNRSGESTTVDMSITHTVARYDSKKLPPLHSAAFIPRLPLAAESDMSTVDLS